MICVPAFALSSFVSSPSLLRRHSLLSSELVHPHAVHLVAPSLASSLHAFRAINKSPSRANPANPLTDAPVPLAPPVPHLLAHVHDPLRSRDELVPPLPASFERMLEDREIYRPASRWLYSRSFSRTHGRGQNFSCGFVWAQGSIFLANLTNLKGFRKIVFRFFFFEIIFIISEPFYNLVS